MKRRVASILAALVLVTAIPATVLAKPSTSPFDGTWVSEDYDGSAQLLLVAGGGHPSVVYEDFYANGCDTYGGPATHWVSSGRGSIDGDTLYVDFYVKTGCGTFLLHEGYSDWYVYDGGSDTLTDSFGITWYRMT